jgi:ribonuclease P protein component
MVRSSDGRLLMAKIKPKGLSRAERLRTAHDFQAVFERRCSARDEWLQVYGLPNRRAISRIGLSVGRKWGGAVVRNRIRRLYREAFRLTKALLPGGLDLVFVPRKTEGLTLAVLSDNVPRLVGNVAERLTKSQTRN